MHSKRGLITAGIVTFVIALIVLFPARVAYRWFVPAEIAISGISGTVWKGRAEEASVSGLYLRDLNWNAKPLQLLTGKAAYHVTGRSSSGTLQSDVAINVGGTVILTSLSAEVPLELLATFSGVQGLQGSSNFLFERIEISDGIAVAADGVLRVSKLRLPAAGRDELGSYKAEFFTQDSGIGASVEDIDGVIDLAGRLELSNDRSFSFLGMLVATPQTPAGIRQQIRYLPSGDKAGQHELRLEGTL